MALVNFVHYLQDERTSSELRECIENTAGMDISDELMNRIGCPFYEVKLYCTLDTETGKVTLNTARFT